MFKKLLGVDEANEIVHFEMYFRRNWPLAVAILLIAVGIAFSIYMYRREGAVSRLLRIVLGALRATLIALIIFVLWQPVMALDMSSKLRGIVLVMMDVSESMAIADPRNTKDEQDDAALALGKKKFEDINQPTPPAMAKDVAAVPRIDIAKGILENKELDLLNKFGAENKVRLFAFGENLLPSNQEGASAEFLKKSSASSKATALGSAIDDAVSQYGGQPIAGVVLLTDGGSNKGIDPLEVAGELKKRKIPLFPVGIGIAEPPDVQVQAIVVQETAFNKDKVPIRVQLQSKGFRSQPAILRLSLDGLEIQSKPITLTGQTQFEELTFEPEGKAGTVKLEASVPVLPGETLVENNKLSTTMTIIDEKIKVLYVEGAPRWEYRYLRAVLLRDPRLEVKFLMTEGDPNLARYSPQYLSRFPEDAEDAFHFDLVILGDVPASYFNSAQMQRIEELVKNRSGSLLLLAGPMYAPATYAGTPIEQMLPVKLGAEERQLLAEDIYPVITPAGVQSAAMSLDPSKDKNDALWSVVRPLHHVPALIGAKPGAIVLAELSDTLHRTEPYPLIAWSRYGNGKTFFVGSDQLWRLRFKRGDKYHARYWGQVIRFLTLSRLMGGNKRAQMQTDRTSYQAHDRVQVFATVVNEAYEPIQAQNYTVFVERAGAPDKTASVKLDVVPDKPGFFQGAYVPEEDGRYSIRPRVEDAALANKLEIDVATVPLEQREPAMQERALKELAQISGGRYFTVRELPALPRALKKEERATQIRMEKELWDSPLVYVLIVLLAGTEWFIRRRHDLA
ncbi:MAG TPA: VWA domain-containing protein [Planctomycetota bacterium]|nr:VWA domain-containing protein [Planctomycetota bacterium]